MGYTGGHTCLLSMYRAALLCSVCVLCYFVLSGIGYFMEVARVWVIKFLNLSGLYEILLEEI